MSDESVALSCAIAVMAKASAPGRTKTRLAPPLTFDEAAAFNTAFLQDIASKMLLAGLKAPIEPFMAFGPPGSEPFFRSILPGRVGLIDAWTPDFGACLLKAITVMLDAGHGSACVLNSDSPTLPHAYLVEAARLLAQPGDRAVLGPSTDGGYYLLGLKRAHRRLFEDITWSTAVVAEQTLARAREIGLPVHILPTWYDVDDADSLRQLLADIDTVRRSPPRRIGPDRADATAALFRKLETTADLLRRLGCQAGVVPPSSARHSPAGATV